ncbi:hypothetical protein SBA1_440029 [Candidatus Sulfotelmatobacter kueseliae]|uniref:Uncharacterized protein n=1 Tax=Candidatus Sulfotelmatobacter kueseliae TaxID=2042962 RepID=A0A2U3KRR2_9BACT|nr:hypothetical protein SBA1_440029 [Candidatus Sulfotelmatobacter kueseliae]
MLDVIGKADETGLAVNVGAEFEVELADVHEAIGDVDLHFGSVDGSASRIVDGEVGGAGTDAAIDHWNRMGVAWRGTGGLREGQGCGTGEEDQPEGEPPKSFRMHD